MILEDDAVLVKGFEEKLDAVIKELPFDWNALWLNGTETKRGFTISGNLRKVKEMWGTFGYLLNSSFYDVVIEGLEKETKSADGFFTSIQKNNQCFATVKPLVKHRRGVSDIAGVVVSHYKHLE